MEPIIANGRLMKYPVIEGWYWFHEEGRPYEPSLYYVYKKDDEWVCSRRDYKGSTPNSFADHKQQDHLFAIEFIGACLPTAVMPTKSGYYWVTSRNGTRGIVRVRCV